MSPPAAATAAAAAAAPRPLLTWRTTELLNPAPSGPAAASSVGLLLVRAAPLPACGLPNGWQLASAGSSNEAQSAKLVVLTGGAAPANSCCGRGYACCAAGLNSTGLARSNSAGETVEAAAAASPCCCCSLASVEPVPSLLATCCSEAARLPSGDGPGCCCWCCCIGGSGCCCTTDDDVEAWNREPKDRLAPIPSPRGPVLPAVRAAPAAGASWLTRDDTATTKRQGNASWQQCFCTHRLRQVHRMVSLPALPTQSCSACAPEEESSSSSSDPKNMSGRSWSSEGTAPLSLARPTKFLQERSKAGCCRQAGCRGESVRRFGAASWPQAAEWHRSSLLPVPCHPRHSLRGQICEGARPAAAAEAAGTAVRHERGGGRGGAAPRQA